MSHGLARIYTGMALILGTQHLCIADAIEKESMGPSRKERAQDDRVVAR